MIFDGKISVDLARLQRMTGNYRIQRLEGLRSLRALYPLFLVVFLGRNERRAHAFYLYHPRFWPKQPAAATTKLDAERLLDGQLVLTVET
jgi:hypothetical protein